jgi:hypothetical protein
LRQGNVLDRAPPVLGLIINSGVHSSRVVPVKYLGGYDKYDLYDLRLEARRPLHLMRVKEQKCRAVPANISIGIYVGATVDNKPLSPLRGHPCRGAL